MKKLKIDWKDVIKVIEDFYKIKDVKLMHSVSYERDQEICELPEYIEGEKE